MEELLGALLVEMIGPFLGWLLGILLEAVMWVIVELVLEGLLRAVWRVLSSAVAFARRAAGGWLAQRNAARHERRGAATDGLPCPTATLNAPLADRDHQPEEARHG